ncbi:alpha/beta hydrolase-fold protein [Corynebacterium xerosis]|uniref:alpha/beta hydrolase-fold protein n=1 Tax=Corynebacterium xerosis TaxID=1725 RepID=UPI00387A2357
MQAAVVAVLLVARDAQVHLPPAYFAHPRPKLPVVVLVSGAPGSPEQWFVEGRAGQTLDAFAEGHRGLAPITVAVDANGPRSRTPTASTPRPPGTR